MNWHYSKRMPSGKLVHVGVWEGGKFIGVVIFGRGATPEIGKPYGLEQTGIVELVRIALGTHATPVSRIAAIALKMLRQSSPGIRLVVSFADSAEGHHGGIYQAMNWVYAGYARKPVLVVHGVHCHPRSLGAKYGVGGQSIPWLRKYVDPKAEYCYFGVKYRYLYPLDEAMRTQIQPLSKPYPKRAGSIDSDALGFQPREGSVNLTSTLQKSR